MEESLSVGLPLNLVLYICRPLTLNYNGTGRKCTTVSDFFPPRSESERVNDYVLEEEPRDQEAP